MYAPNNAICAVVGDVRPAVVLGLAERYFGILKAQPSPPPVFTDEPEQEGERRIEVEFDSKPHVMIGWHTPGVAHADIGPLSVLSQILSTGRTSRFYKAIEEKKLAVNVNASLDEQRYPALFTVSGAPVAPHTTAELEQAIYDEIARLTTEPVSDWELSRTQNQLRANYLRSLRRPMGIAFQLTDSEAVAGDFNYWRQGTENELRVTAADVTRVVAAYFKKPNRTVITLIPTKSAKPKEPIHLKPGQLHHGGGEGG